MVLYKCKIKNRRDAKKMKKEGITNMDKKQSKRLNMALK